MSFFRNNGLTLVFFALFLLSLGGQFWFGFQEYNQERQLEGYAAVTTVDYVSSGHFIQATFENWESEFLQMALFVVFTIFLQQRGSSESKDFARKEEVDRKPNPRRRGAPWAVRKGGLWLKLYSHSLTFFLFLLFLISFALHFKGSWMDENEQLLMKGQPPETAMDYLADPRFWFESFQNWQSEFLSVMTIVLASIWLRQKGSSQSKPVDAPHDETGE